MSEDRVLTLARLNILPAAEAEAWLLLCCGSSRWARAMAAARPFKTLTDLEERAYRELAALTREDWLEAFSHHPRIGEKQLREKFAPARPVVLAKGQTWSNQEQKGVQTASEATIKGLAEGNREYEERFGHVFLICATGKSADEMLEALRRRLGNSAETELNIAAGEHAQITRLRIHKMVSDS